MGPEGRWFESSRPDDVIFARIAQLVERHLAKVDVAGSSPVSRSVHYCPYGDFEYVWAASSGVEHLTFNQGVVGSNPTRLIFLNDINPLKAGFVVLGSL